MQTMEQVRFAFLQRWPTTTTQEGSFSKEALTRITRLMVYYINPTTTLSFSRLCWDTWLSAHSQKRAIPTSILLLFP